MQSCIFKMLIESLKELLTDTVIKITPKGLKIVTMDNSRVVLVHLKLHASKFEQFYCDGTKLLGINMINFYKIIKAVTGNDTLTLFMEHDDINHLGIRIENEEKNTQTVYKFNLLDLPHENVSIPPTSFTSVITLESPDFQKICRDMSVIADTIEIKNIKQQLILSCRGDVCSQETVISETATPNTDIPPEEQDEEDHDDILQNDSHKDTESEIFQGVYSLKHLVQFTKCTNLSSIVEIYLKNDYPLIVRYKVGSLGDVKLGVSPIEEED